MYALVFQSGFSVCLIILLFLSFLLQPFHEAYAAETEADAETDTSTATDDQTAAESTASTPPSTSSPEESLPMPEHEQPAEPEPEPSESNPMTTSESSDEDTDEPANDRASTEAAETAAELASSDEFQADSTPEEVGGGEVEDPVTAPATSTQETEPAEPASTTIATVAAPSSAASSSSVSADSTATTTDTAQSEPSATTSTTSTPTSNASDASPGEESEESTEAEPQSGATSGVAGGGSDTTENAQVSDTTGTDDSASGTLTGGGEDTDSSGASDPTEELAPTSTKTASSSASSSEAVVAPATPAQPVERIVTDENFFQFSKQSCVAVGNGTYHCSVNEGTAIDDRAVVFSDLGENGSQEIFIKTADERVQQITDSPYDDTAPYYDAETLQIVWQRFIDGRHQIILYDLRAEEETQLTFGRTNSMEPAVSAAGVAWQMWDGSDWEIMFHNGTFTEALTENETQEVSPVLQDGYVIWTVIGSRSQTAQVYSIETGETATIVNHEGGEIVNPRFVLIYDTQFENGDVITKRFDPETGFSEAIAAKPAPEPIDIPESESTGEIRALIQNKSSSKEDAASDDTDSGDGNSTPALGSGSSTASTSTETLDLTNASSSAPLEVEVLETVADEEASSTPATGEAPLELDEYDLVIGTDGSASTTSSTTVSTASSSASAASSTEATAETPPIEDD